MRVANFHQLGAVDPQRTSYFANYTSSLRDAIYDDNVNIQGFFGWSLMDNFEWAFVRALRMRCHTRPFAGLQMPPRGMVPLSVE